MIVDIIVFVASPLFFLCLGLLFGTWIQRRHLRELARRESVLRGRLMVTDLRTAPPGLAAGRAALVTGSVVVSADYFRAFLAKLKKIIGGELGTFNTLMERGRREAVCRVLEEASELGAEAVVNLRVETSTLLGDKHEPRPILEIVAYATALAPASAQDAAPVDEGSARVVLR